MSNDDQRLAPLRAKIDTIDAELLTLLSKRAKAAQEVGHIKNESSTPIFRPERENQVIQHVLSKNLGPLLPDGIASIWREIMSACRALESRQTIAYLGPVGTFSELAAQQFFGQSIQGLPCASLDEVFKSVEKGLKPREEVVVEFLYEDGSSKKINVLSRIDTDNETEYYKHGGILQYVLRNMA